MNILYILLLCIFDTSWSEHKEMKPVVISTWNFKEANKKAFEILLKTGSSVDAVEEGCRRCEELQCDGTVGYGGSPDENGETTLDAMIMDGSNMNVGAVGALRKVKNAIGVARKVLENTRHTLLVGSQATEFALQLGFEEESLTTEVSENIWKNWKKKNCQPNFWMNVIPNPTKQCGPYKSIHPNSIQEEKHQSLVKDLKSYFHETNHDTIGMIAINSFGHVVAGTSTNGARHKIPGRVGDSPIAGAGAYADDSVGGAAGTGDGDVMMRFLPSYLAVEEMRRGSSPTNAAATAIKRIVEKYPNFSGAVIAINKYGEHGAACNNVNKFPYLISNDPEQKEPTLVLINC